MIATPERLPLPQATPEDMGVHSGKVSRFVSRIEDRALSLHAVIILRHGAIIAEWYYAPMRADMLHRLYSVSKSLVSLAVGLMIDDERISPDDTVVSFFPELTPNDANDWLKAATIRDMLMMTDCHDQTTYTFEDGNWLKTWFDTPATRPSGMTFTYNTACSNLLAAIVEKLSGMKFLDYMRPKLLDPLGVSQNAICIEAPGGDSFGGSGVLMTARDLAKIALCVMRGGDGFVSDSYIKAATARQVDNTITNSDIEHQQGYGYQIWRTRHDGFAFYGMGSQLAVCLPKQDLCVITLGDTQAISPDTSEIMQAIWEELLPGLHDGALPASEDYDDLMARIGELRLQMPRGDAYFDLPAKTYTMRKNPMNITRVRFIYADNAVIMQYENATGAHELRFGVRSHIAQAFPETHYSGRLIRMPKGEGYACLCSGAFVDERTLLLRAYIVDDYFGTLNISATFEGDTLSLLMSKSAEDFLDDYQGYAAGIAE